MMIARTHQYNLLQAIFGQIGTLVREPLIRVRTSEYTEYT